MITTRPPHTHTARILRFADADTAVVLLDIGFGTHVEKYVRLEGIESWELNSPDRERAISARDALDSMLRDRPCLLHLRGRGHDKYARLRGSITVGDVDLATRIVEMGYAWHCTAKASAQAHAAARTTLGAVLAATAGCYTSRDASTLVVLDGHSGGSTTNSAGRVIQTVTASPHQSAATATHYVLYTLAGLAACALVAGIIWVIHNRAKLIGEATALAAKV